MAGAFRHYVDDSRQNLPHQFPTYDRQEYSTAILADPKIKAIFEKWEAQLEEPFYGITSDGRIQRNLYALEDQNAPSAQAAEAAHLFLDTLTPDQAMVAERDIDAEDWRKWTNTEIVRYGIGVTLTELAPNQRDLAWNMVRQSLSHTGYHKIRNATKINHFLGQISGSPIVLNELAYAFAVYGKPSSKEPWGFSIVGHHVVVFVYFIGNQMAVGPVFLGCEPDASIIKIIDEGPDKGIEMLYDDVQSGLKLMRSLDPVQQQQARKITILSADDPDFNLIDQRHLCGSFQDNRIVPFEGIPATALGQDQQKLLLEVIAASQTLLPPTSFEHRMSAIRANLGQTHFGWHGGFGDRDAFYYRIVSPVVVVELDCHSGIYLTNREPAVFHKHSIQRQPNGNDYGRELIRLWRESNPRTTHTHRLPNIRASDPRLAFDTGFPKYLAQILSASERALLIASTIGQGGRGPGLHYHTSAQIYYMIKGSTNIQLGDQVHRAEQGSLVYIPPGLPHCNWNDGPGDGLHLEIILPNPPRMEPIAHMINAPSDVPIQHQTTRRGYVMPLRREAMKQPLEGFYLQALADPSTGCDIAVIFSAEVAPSKGGPSTHVHDFDQHYFVLDGEMTVELALRKDVVRSGQLVVIPAGVPHRNYNAGTGVERHLTINTPVPDQGRLWDYGLHDMKANGKGIHGTFDATNNLHYM